MRLSTFAVLTGAITVGFCFGACGSNCGGGQPDSGIPGLTDAGCIAQGFGCDSTSPACCGGAICNGTCGASNCGAPTTPCNTAGDCCGGAQCLSNQCGGPTGTAPACMAIGTTCSTGTDCCTTICNGTCQAIPGQASGCGILGTTCTGAGDCCSNVCQGGVCAPQYSCRANDDICTSGAQCCSLMCNIVSGTVGSCKAPSGGGPNLGISGTPCDSATDCATKTCVNVGTGTLICQPTSGCRVSGDACASTNACCGKLTCTERCDNGTSCRASGTICGKPSVALDGGGYDCARTPAGACYDVPNETNCCTGTKVGGGMEDVCHVDIGGIPRCFGGGGVPGCPAGYNGTAGCCIAIGNYCDFRDQCCGGGICADGADGGRQCQVGTCKTSGTTCANTSDCCFGLVCANDGEFNALTCQPASGPVCKANTAPCTAGSQCCSGICDGTGHCAMQTSCQNTGGNCSAAADCCAGLICNLPAASTSGTCAVPSGVNPDGGGGPGPGPDGGGGPPPVCINQGQTCSTATAGNCCGGFECLNGLSQPCTGSTACTCQIIIQ